VSEREMQQGEHFFQEILSSAFNGSSGEVSLLRNGDRDNRTIVVSVDNLRKDGTFAQVGEVQQSDDPATQLNFNLSAIMWADGTHKVPWDGIEAEARSDKELRKLKRARERAGLVALVFLIIAAFLFVAWRRERVAKQRAQEELEQELLVHEDLMSTPQLNACLKDGKLRQAWAQRIAGTHKEARSAFML
jgi:hypothetical protein